MRPLYLFAGAMACGLLGAVGSLLIAPPQRANQATIPIAMQTAGGWDNAVEPAQTVPPQNGAALTPAAASTAPGGLVQLCPGREQVTMAGGRLLGHIPYAEADPANLTAPPAGFETTNCARIDRDMKEALTQLIAAAAKDDPQIGKMIKGVSCFRSVERQRGLFCAPAKLDQRGIAGQAKWIAPPGFSEHATGFAIDFGVKSKPECDANPCFSQTRTGQWLAGNARRFGFELSFPSGNRQGVSYEPWHWRWTGSDRAKAIFARARKDFPSP